MDHACGIWTFFVRYSLSVVFRFEFKLYPTSLTLIGFACWQRGCEIHEVSNRSFDGLAVIMLAISLIGLLSIRSFSIKSDTPNHENSCFGSSGIQRMKLSDSVFLSHLSFLKVAVVLNSRKLLFWLCQLASLKSAIMSLPLLNRSSIKLVLLLQCRYSLSSCTWWTCKVYVRHILYMPTPREYCFSIEF